MTHVWILRTDFDAWCVSLPFVEHIGIKLAIWVCYSEIGYPDIRNNISVRCYKMTYTVIGVHFWYTDFWYLCINSWNNFVLLFWQTVGRSISCYAVKFQMLWKLKNTKKNKRIAVELILRQLLIMLNTLHKKYDLLTINS